MIYHWCPSEDWESTGDVYTTHTLEMEGFIHFSTRDQVERTATSLDRGRRGLVLLSVDESGLEVFYEDCYEVGEEFPHVYQPVPRESVVAVTPFPPESDGSFRFPARADG